MVENNLEAKLDTPEKICMLAEIAELSGEDIYLCSGCYGKAPDVPMLFLADGDLCIATTLYSTGHINPDVSTNISQMKGCEHYLPD